MSNFRNNGNENNANAKNGNPVSNSKSRKSNANDRMIK